MSDIIYFDAGESVQNYLVKADSGLTTEYSCWTEIPEIEELLSIKKDKIMK